MSSCLWFACDRHKATEMTFTNPYKASPKTKPADVEQPRRCGLLFHIVGIAFLFLACFSWFLIWDYMRPEMIKSDSSYQLLGVLFLLAFFAAVPVIGYTWFHAMRFSSMSGFCRTMLLVYVLPLVGAWLTAVFVYR